MLKTAIYPILALKGPPTNNFPILLPSSPHLLSFFGRKIFGVAIATPQILLGQKNKIWDKSDNQSEKLICGRALRSILALFY